MAVEVADRGVGFPEGDERHIFDKFYRVQQPGRVSGTGLGLAIAKGIVEAHGGEIAAGPPAGRRIGLPLHPAAGQGGAMTEPNRLRVLIVDDEHAIRRFLRASLAAHGYAVYEAAAGEEALQAVITARPDIVILDLGLPDMDGVEVTRRLREWSAMPVIILSVRNDEAEKIAGAGRRRGRLPDQAVRGGRAAGADPCGPAPPRARARQPDADGRRSRGRPRPGGW